jgi:hypothetical protein
MSAWRLLIRRIRHKIFLLTLLLAKNLFAGFHVVVDVDNWFLIFAASTVRHLEVRRSVLVQIGIFPVHIKVV